MAEPSTRPDPLGKSKLRHLAMQRRKEQPDKEQLSQVISGRLMSLEAYQRAKCVLIYVHVRTEVRTHRLIQHAIQSGKRTFVPYCDGNLLRLFRIDGLDELVRGRFGILEPPDEAKTQATRHTGIESIQLAVVPGVAFGRDGTRIGYGKGYFDRLLAAAPASTTTVGTAFECQMFDRVPAGPRDVLLSMVVTETNSYPDS